MFCSIYNQVINGLMDRPDWELAIKKPIGALPGGSGNALACSLAYQIGYVCIYSFVIVY